MEESEYRHPRATWYIIGVGGTGCNVVDAFFRTLNYKLIRIAPRFSFKNDNEQKYLTEVILEYGVPGKFGWWIYNTSMRDLSNTSIIWSKLKTLYPKIEEERTGEHTAAQGQASKKWTRRISDEIAYEYKIQEHFTSGFAMAEGAGKFWSSGQTSTIQMLDPDYWKEITGKKEPKIKYVLDTLEKGLWRISNGLLVIHGLGRGTGSGATHRIIRTLKQIRKDLHIVTLSIFPSISSSTSRYEDAIIQSMFGLLSVLQDENDKKLAGAVMLAHNDICHMLCLKERKSFLYSDKSLRFRGHRLFPRVSKGGKGKESYNRILVDLIGLLSSTHIRGREEEAFDLNNLVKSVEYPTSDPEFPGILVPCVFISPKRKATSQELITGALQEGKLVECDPSTSKAIYIILFLDVNVEGNSLSDIYHVPDETISKLYPDLKIPKLKTPDYIDTRGAFAAAVIFLINPRIPLIEEYYKVTEDYFERLMANPRLRVETEALQMHETWEKGYKERAGKLLEMLTRNK